MYIYRESVKGYENHEKIFEPAPGAGVGAGHASCYCDCGCRGLHIPFHQL